MVHKLWSRYTRDERALAFAVPGSILGLIAGLIFEPANAAVLVTAAVAGTALIGIGVLPLVARWTRTPAPGRIRIT